MPLISACQLPPPRNWQDLESLCADLWREEWNDPNVQRVGRAGQSQDGVDICGRLENGEWAGIQCKSIRADLVIPEDDLIHQVANARSFRPQLSQYLIATTGLKDARLETTCRRITQEHAKTGDFGVAIYNWADICLLLERHPSVARSHFPFVITSVAPIVLNNEGANPQVESHHLQYSFSREEFVHPRIVEELLGVMSDRRETVVSVDLSSANKSNKFYGDVRIIPDCDGPWVEYEYELNHPFERHPYCRYQQLGTSPSGIHILRTMRGGGGTGHFSDLCFLTLQTDNGLTLDSGTLAARERILLKTLGSIPIGDRYHGIIEFKDDVLSVREDQNSYGCLKEGFSIRVD
jgi:hypothetical protein